MIRLLTKWRYARLAKRGFFVFQLGNKWYVRDPIQILLRINREDVANLLQEVQTMTTADQYDADKIEKAYRAVAEVFDLPLGVEGASYSELNDLMALFHEWFDVQKKTLNLSHS